MNNEMLIWLRGHLQQTPLDELKKEWKEIEEMGFDGPNAFEYLNFLKSYYCPYNPDKLLSEMRINLENMTSNFSGSFFLCNIAA